MDRCSATHPGFETWPSTGGGCLRKIEGVWSGFAITLCAVIVWTPSARAGQPLETESARLPRRGTFELDAGVERQTSTAGTELATPFALAYGISDRMELLVEPVFYTGIHDKGVGPVHGMGDLEMTLTSIFRKEHGGTPALGLGAEVKLPTAVSRRIGTGKADFSLFLLASKRAGAWDSHANVGCTLVGKPAGASVHNIATFAVSEEYHATRSWELVSEVFGSSAAVGESADAPGSGPEGSLTPELSAGELVGAVGARFRANESLTYSLGVSYDNSRAILVHPGVTLRW